ncbi:MAG: guanylate kinase, partial [Rikenellaceae bacterium]|nr:guanylate kinase [Rikenellaceae bacterium]
MKSGNFFTGYPDANKVVIISAPSGAGKTTIVKRIMARFPTLEFSISVTRRRLRGT